MLALLRPWRTSLGGKFVMALTGLGLIVFVLGHMAGNLLLFLGRDAINTYGQTLKSHAELLWAARGALLTIFVVHVIVGIRLTLANRAARPVRYQRDAAVKASLASRHMLLTGLVLLAFILYHLGHYTFGFFNTAEVKRPDGMIVATSYLDLDDADYARANPGHYRHDVYSMVVAGFQNPFVSVSYLIAMVFLFLHLWHGGSSWFQSLGINHPGYQAFLGWLGPAIATLVLIGNCSIPLAVWSGLIR
jgi:succinate dehydrogenase / fumarate reductase, cytochrome b subunit